MKQKTRAELIKKINNGLKRKSRKYMQDLIYDMNKKKESVEYESVPAKLKIEGKKYNLIVYRRKSDLQPLPLLLK